jgi:DNA-binding MarR family transcriptional regulator
VKRKRDKKDERQVIITLTEKGRELQNCMLGDSEEQVEALKHAVDELKHLLRKAA